MANIKSIAQLKKELAAREKQLAKLETQKAKLEKSLKAVEDKMIAILGPGGTQSRVLSGPTNGRRRAKRGRARSKRPLPDYIKDVLEGSKTGIRARDIAAEIVKAGYPTRSKDFYNTVAATLAADKRFKRVSRGVYKL